MEGFIKSGENLENNKNSRKRKLGDQSTPLDRQKRIRPWNFFSPEQDQPRQHEADRIQAEAQFKETLNRIGTYYNFYEEFANFIKKVEDFTAQPQSQVRLEEWQKLAREAKVFQNFPGSQINRLDLANKLSSLLDRDVEQLDNFIPPDSQESLYNAVRILAYIKSDKRHDFSVPQEKAQEIESRCEGTFTQRSQKLRERYHIGVYPERISPPFLAKEFGGSERFVQIKMSSYENLDLPKDASGEAIQQALSRDSDYTCYVNRADNVIIVSSIFRDKDAYEWARVRELLKQKKQYKVSEVLQEACTNPENYNYAKTLPSSEVLFYMYQAADQHFRETNPKSTPKDDKITVIICNITNEQSKRVLEKLNISEGQKMTYLKYKEANIFRELKNTPNGRPLFFALAQHPELFGRLEVDRIEVRHDYGYYHMIQHTSLNDNHPQEA